MLFERTAISRQPETLIQRELEQLRETDRETPDLVFRDPNLLDFLGLADAFSERDLEAAILRDIEPFLLELGTDFGFLARQKRRTIGSQDYYLDLLFYHRGLARLVAVELGRFEASYKSQMDLYLRWLDKYERLAPSENAPTGLILCSGKSEEQIELLQLNDGEIRVAEYLTALPDRAVLEAKLYDAVILARRRIEAITDESTWIVYHVRADGISETTSQTLRFDGKEYACGDVGLEQRPDTVGSTKLASRAAEVPTRSREGSSAEWYARFPRTASA